MDGSYGIAAGVSRAPSLSVYRPFGAFRLLLAGLVMVQHGLLLLPVADRDVFYRLELGVVAVAVFFALSGFIVAEAGTAFYADRPCAFLLNRVLRLVPPYLAALTLSVAVHATLAAQGRLVTLDAPLVGAALAPRTLLAGLLDIVPGFQPRYLTGHAFVFVPFAWTLRVEFTFYLVAFAVFWWGARAGRAGLRRAAWAAFGAGYAACLVSVARHGAGFQLPLFVPFFALGGAAFLLWRDRRRLNRLHLLVAAGLAAAAFPCWIQQGRPVLAIQGPILLGLLGVLLALAWAPAIGRRSRRWDRRAGDLSYPLYINHGTVLVLLGSLAPRGWASYGAAIPLSLLLAWVMRRVVEAPLGGLRDRVRGRAL